MSLRPTFLGINTMLSAVKASQKSLDIVGNNIANADTIGYTRQRLDLVSVATSGGGLGYKTSVGLAGQGVSASGVTQIRDELLDKRYRELNADTAEYTTKTKVLTSVEDALNFIKTDGFYTMYTDFKTNLSSLASNSTDSSSIASVVLTSAQQMVQTLRSYSTGLDKIQEQTKYEMQTAVDNVSSILKRIAELNGQITDEYVASGDIIFDGSTYTANTVYGPNELKDTRNALLDELSTYGNIEVSTNDDGSINVNFAGQTVVENESYSKLSMEEHSTGTLSLILTSSGGNETKISVSSEGLKSGALKGYLDIYNGAGVYDKDISIRQDGMQNTVDEINNILSEISKITDSTNGAALRNKLEAKLQAYNSNFAIDNTTGEVTFDGTTVVSAIGAATNVLNKFSISVNDANTAINYIFNGSEVSSSLIDGTMKTVKDDTADNNFTSTQGLVYYRKAIDALANTMATAYNTACSDTTLVDSSGNYYVRKMFDSSDGGTVTAGNIKISDEWNSNALMIAQGCEYVYGDPLNPTTPTGIKTVVSSGKELDTACVNKIISVASKDLSFTIDGNNITNADDKYVDITCTIDEYYSYLMVSQLGEDIEYATSCYDTANTMATSVLESRDSVMGVMVDEEAANMLVYQKWFNAASRMMTTFDEALDTIINSMGLVGRG